MKKILIVLALVIVLIGVASTIFISKLDGVIADAIKKHGSEALGTSVSVSAVKTNLSEGSIIISGLNIANPSGYSQKNAFNMGEFSTTVDYEKREIAEVVLRNASINAELKGAQSNFKDLLDGIPNSDSNSSTNSDDEPNIKIQSLKILSAKVNLMTDSIGEHSFIMGDFILRNISGTPSEIADNVTRKLTQHISDQVKNYAQDTIKSEAAALAKEKAKEKINEAINKNIGSKLKGFNLKLN